MVFTVYISYSNEDRHLADTLYSILKQNKINVWAIENEYIDNRTVLKDIKNYMEKSDLIVFLLNKVNINSRNITSEYAIANSLEKNIVTMVDKYTIIPYDLRDIPHILIDKYNYNETLNNIASYSLNLKKEKDRNQTVGVLLLLGALALIFSKDDSSGE